MNAAKGWDPDAYRTFAGPRLAPAIDLLDGIGSVAPKTILDLGCGEGRATRLLRARWPDAAVTAVDSSAAMLARARAEGGGIAWVEADIATYAPGRRFDLVFSNAALHWLDGHDGLFPRLMGYLAPGGVLAVQMPRNHGAPSHTLLADAAGDGPWAERLAPLLRPAPVAAPETYRALLAPLSAGLDVWETVYAHELEGADPVLAWVHGTALKPLLDALDDADAGGAWKRQFESAYASRLAAAYPERDDGITVFPFRRLFIVARAKAEYPAG